MSDMVLEGGISYNKYIWHSSGNACEACQDLDCTEYEYEGDIPDLPHPNCQCYIEVVKGDEDEEACDCCEAAEEIEEIVGDSESLIEELEYEIEDMDTVTSDLPEDIGEEAQSILELLLEKTEEMRIILQTVFIFASNFKQLLDIEDGKCDKYFHAKANCETAQLGVTGEATAEALSNYKESFDATIKAIAESIILKTKFQQALINKIKDGDEDQEANKEGREVGRNNPNGDCGEILKHKLPKDKQW